MKQAAANRETTIKALHAAGLKNITITLPDGTTFRVSADDTKPESADEDLLDRL